MGLLSDWFKGSVEKGDGNTISHVDYRGLDFTHIDTVSNNYSYWFNHKDYGCYYKYVHAYNNSPTISAVINYQSTIFANGDTWVLRRSGKQKDEEINTKEAKKIKSLLRKPNKYETQTQFETRLITNVRLFGWCLVYIEKPVGFPNIDASSIHVVSPSRVRFEFDGSLNIRNKGWDSVKSIHAFIGTDKKGVEQKLSKDNCYIIKDSTPIFSYDSFLPQSRLDTILYPIQNEVTGLESRNTLLRERGIRGIITNETTDSNSFIPVNKEEKNELMSELKRQYGLLRNQFQIAFSNKSLRWQSMAMSTKDLMLFEEDANTVAKICDAFMFPKGLLSDGSGQGEKFSNMQIMTRNLYLNVIMPLAKDIFEQLNDLFETDKYDILIERDYSANPSLQPDRKEEAEANLRTNQSCNIAFQMNVIHLNEWRKMLGLDPIPEYEDKFYSDIKDLVNATVDIKDTQVNDGTSMNTINNEGTLNETV